MRAICLCLWLALAACREQPEPSPVPKAKAVREDLALLTSLPIVFAEEFTLDAPRQPLLEALEREFVVRPVDGPEQLRERGLLLAIQPQALAAERLVALDRWVRRGGRLVLLADPQLEWESSRPLGDRFRPPYAFPDTGLLQHWGVTLTAAEPGRAGDRELGSRQVATRSPGVLAATKGQCQTDRAGFVANCRVGRGRVRIIADADWAIAEPSSPATGQPASQHEALLDLLGRD